MWVRRMDCGSRKLLRTRQNGAGGAVMPYTYLGRLSYLTHDSERERPVYFQWQLIDTWPPPADVLSRMALTLTQSDAPTPLVEQAGLSQTPPPVPSRRKGRRTADFRARRVADRSVEDAN